MTSVRRAGTASVTTLLACALIMGATQLMAPEWASVAGFDVWDLPSLEEQLRTSQMKDRIYSQEIVDSQNRIAAKEVSIDNLVKGRASLKETTAAFIAFNQDRQASDKALRAAYRGRTTEERTAQNVIDFALVQSRGSFGSKLSLAARLSREHREMFPEGTGPR